MRLVLLLLLIPSIVFAEISFQGEAAFEGRQFKDDNNDVTEDTGTALYSLLQLDYKGEYFDLRFRGFGRYDASDSSRTIFILEDAYYKSFIGEDEEISVIGGFKVFNWTAMEAFHPVDQINSRNFDSPIENLEKKGELTIEVNKTVGEGELSFYFWPLYIAPNFPSQKGRLGAGADLANPRFIDGEEEDTKEFGVQFGTRISQTFDDFDVSLHYIHHMDRLYALVGTENYVFNPLLGQNIPLNTPNQPYYFKVNQVGGTLQYVMNSHMFKFETAARIYQEEKVIWTFRGLRKPVDHQESAAGWEYSIAHDSGSESFLYAEVNFFTGVNKETRSELWAFQRDLFLGYRYAFNDAAGKELMTTFIVDLERSHEYFASISYSQRFGNNWKLNTGFRYYDAPPKESVAVGLETFHQDNQFSLTLTRYF